MFIIMPVQLNIGDDYGQSLHLWMSKNDPCLNTLAIENAFVSHMVKKNDLDNSAMSVTEKTRYTDMNIRDTLHIVNNEPEIMERFCLVNEFQPDTDVTQVHDEQVNFTYTVNDANHLITREVQVDDNSAPFINANIKLYASDGIIDGAILDASNNMKVTFDLDDSNYNGFKAANYDKYVGEHGINSTVKLDFNNQYALLSFDEIARDTSSNELSANDNLLSDLSFNGIDVTLTDNTNALPMFGTYKFEQKPKEIIVEQENLDTLVNQDQNQLPSEFNESEWNNLWSQDILDVLGSNTEFTISTVSNSGGYYCDNVGFSLDDSNLNNNIEYMEHATGVHTLLIENGYLEKTSNVSDISNNSGMYSIIDSSESLNESQYKDDLTIKLWFTKQTNTFELPTGDESNFLNGLQRTSISESSGTTFTGISVYYPGEELLAGDTNVLVDTDLTTYDISYNIEVIALSTSNNVTSYDFNNVISKSNEDWVAIIPDTTTNMDKTHFQNFNTDFNINSLIDLSVNEISVFNVKSSYIWTEQIYHTDINDPKVNVLDSDSTPVSGTNIFVKGSNVDLNNIATDLRLIMEPKNIDDLPSFNNSNFTREFTNEYTNVASNKSIVNIMGTDTYDIINSDASNDILTFVYTFGSNEVAQNIDMLSNMINISYTNTNSTINGSIVLPETSITILSSNNNNVSTSPMASNLFTGLPVGYTVFQKIQSVDLQCQIPFTISSICNMTTTTNVFKQLDTCYYVTDNKGRILPDSYLKQIKFNSDGSGLTASRMYSIKLQDNSYDIPVKSFNSSIEFSISDLFLYKIKLQKLVVSEWIDMTNYYPFDIAYDSICTMKLDLSANSIVEIAIDTDKSTTYSNTYICNMALENSSLSFEAEGRVYDITESTVKNYLLENNWDIRNGFMPNNVSYRNINGLNTNMSYTGQNLNDQGILHLDINRFSDNLFSIESNKNIVTNLFFGVIPNNILHVTSYKNNSLFFDKFVFSTDYDNLILDSGVSVTLDRLNSFVSDRISFNLTTDPVSVMLYNDYRGDLWIDSELYPESVTTNSNISVNVRFDKWRGIVRPLDFEGLYQEDVYHRNPTNITFNLEHDGNTWSQYLGDLYVGSTHTINNIDGSSGLLGSIRLIINGLTSKYNDITFDSSSNITVKFDSAHIKLINGNVDASYINLDYDVSFSQVLLYEFQTFGIKAAKVKVYNTERYYILNKHGDLYVYHSPEYVVSNSTKDLLTYDFLYYINYADLQDGVFMNIDGSNSSYSTDNHLNFTWKLIYNKLDINAFTDYCVCPRPQLKCSVFSTNEFNTFPYVGTRVTKYIDLYNDLNQMYPFENIDGVNNLCFSYINNSIETYMKFRTNEFNDLSDLVSYPIISNKLKLDLYYGLSDDGNIFTKTLFDDYITNLISPENQTNVFDVSYNEETLSYSVKAFHDLDLTESAYANLFFGEKPLNLQFSGISDFQIGDNYIDFVSGKTHDLSLITYIQDFDNSLNQMFFTVIKFVDNNRNTMDNVDYSETSFIQASRSLKFNAMKRYTSKIFVSDLSWNDTLPFSYKDFLSNVNNIELDWVLDAEFEPRVLLFSINALCGNSLNILTDFIGVTDSYPVKVAYFNTPDFIRCENALGNAVVRITSMGDVIMDQAILRNIIGYNTYSGVTEQDSPTIFVKYGVEHAPNS